jgi:hypothetical protein
LDNDASAGYGGARLVFDGTADPGSYLFRDEENTAYANCFANTFNVVSDLRLKKDINYLNSTDYNAYLDKIRNVNSITYRFRKEKASDKVHVGFTAQSLPAEVQEKFPSPKRKNSTEDVLGVNLTDMTGLLLTGVKAIDNKQSQLEKTVAEQQQEIEALKKEIQQLKNK